jgi:hypothetical protein
VALNQGGLSRAARLCVIAEVISLSMLEVSVTLTLALESGARVMFYMSFSKYMCSRTRDEKIQANFGVI